MTGLRAPFTVKGGGHTAFAGGSNIADGVTVDLRLLDTITVSTDRKTVSVGAGNRWINVTRVLDPQGLAVVGGRVAEPGVGGLVLGGGISYFSGQKGWACDNVRAYEVVLASGKVVTASPSSNADLYWALRGGPTSNLGVVTRFDLASFDQPTPVWARSLLLPAQLNATLLPLFQNLTVTGLPADEGAHTYLTLLYVPALGGYAFFTDQYHVAPPAIVEPEWQPAAFQAIGALPAISSTTKLANLSTLLESIEQPYGARQTWWNTAVRATSPQLLVDIVPLHEAHVTRILAAANGTDITPFLTFQPIPVNVLRAMQVNGGNALGLAPRDGPLMLIQSAATWASPAIDSVVEASTRRFIQEANALAKKRGLDHGFVYVNYAGKDQDVYASYGNENLARLRKTAKKYDADGDLQKLWKGYFKLW